MNKNVSLREIILLGLLIALIVYNYGVQVPVQGQMDAISAQQIEVQAEIDSKTSMLLAQSHMERSIEQAVDESGNLLLQMPEYDNSDTVMVELNTILSSADTFSIGFTKEDAETSPYVIRRNVSLSYSTAEYATAIDVIERITQSAYANQISDLTITRQEQKQDETDPSVNVALAITFYEYRAQVQK